MKRVQMKFLRVVLVTLLLGSGPAFAGETNDLRSRPADWATKLERPGLSNFYQVTTNLYRGAQPTAQGMAELKAMGVKTVLNPIRD